jgi:hypothetical protein
VNTLSLIESATGFVEDSNMDGEEAEEEIKDSSESSMTGTIPTAEPCTTKRGRGKKP